jgi:hypothetical protein
LGASAVEITCAQREAVETNVFEGGHDMKLYLLTTATLFGVAIAALELAGTAHASALVG